MKFVTLCSIVFLGVLQAGHGQEVCSAMLREYTAVPANTTDCAKGSALTPIALNASVGACTLYPTGNNNLNGRYYNITECRTVNQEKTLIFTMNGNCDQGCSNCLHFFSIQPCETEAELCNRDTAGNREILHEFCKGGSCYDICGKKMQQTTTTPLTSEGTTTPTSLPATPTTSSHAANMKLNYDAFILPSFTFFVLY
eukprot:m.187747 g.187747  ORF g.187747 m.187747 type:complete len:198 (+) comp15613_c0_seq1:160-753(+)